MADAMGSDDLTRTISRAGRGDTDALERLAAATYADVRRLCAALVDADTAEDLAQETLARMVRGVRQFRGEASARTWVLAIARRVCMDELRARSRRTRRDLAVSELAPPPDVLDASGQIEVRDLLARLEPERRAAFALTQLLRLSYDEAATVCGCPTGTIRSRVARAREELIALLEPPAAGLSRKTGVAGDFAVGERGGSPPMRPRSTPDR
jgi:RNA polymerase sigma-70 factor, ECF subfamily